MIATFIKRGEGQYVVIDTESQEALSQWEYYSEVENMDEFGNKRLGALKPPALFKR